MVKVETGQTGGEIRFSIVDTGIGIPRDKHDLIFEKFSQVDATITRRYGGAGLGLAHKPLPHRGYGRNSTHPISAHGRAAR